VGLVSSTTSGEEIVPQSGTELRINMIPNFICKLIDDVHQIILAEENDMDPKPTLASVGLEARRLYQKVYNKTLELRNKVKDMFKYLDDCGMEYSLEDILSENSEFCKMLYEAVAVLTIIHLAVVEFRKPIGE
jgi:hypothetical protein